MIETADSRRAGLGTCVTRISQAVDGFELDIVRDRAASEPIEFS